MQSTRNRLLPAVVAAAAMLLALLAPAVQAKPADAGCANQNFNDRLEKFLRCVSGDGAFEHLEALQAIADENGGTRASGTPGYDASADYVAELLEDAGYTVERQVFEFILFDEISSSLTIDGEDVPTQTFSYSGSGEILDGTVIPVDLALGAGNTSSSGCESSDFDGLDFSGDSDIALVQRGTCSFYVKAAFAQDAGAEAVILFNQGNSDDRLDIIGGTLGETDEVSIPVLDATYATGVLLSEGGSTVSLAVETEVDVRTTENVIGDLAGATSDNVVMAGAHLDSVQVGPGINDNGSGSAALLDIALALGSNKKFTPQNTLRFAWWGAEESGLIGSTQYVFNADFGLTDEEYENLALYLNFDMVGSPNYIYGVYDADESTFEAPVVVPPGSAELEDLFEGFYTYNDIPYEDTAFSGRSDYQAFIDVGIPASGLFTGAEQVKTEEQEAIWGGVAGESYDQCYHQECDTIDNVDPEALDTNVDAIAWAIFQLAYSTEVVNGVEGADVRAPEVTEYDGPQGTFEVEGGGFAVHEDHAVE